jgi:V/A-type H+-transporting ATPase subunit K
VGGWYACCGALGFKIFLEGLRGGFAGFLPAPPRGAPAAAPAGIVAKRREEMGRALILPALVETYAVLSLIVTILVFFTVIKPAMP